jgi:hypothetical protein
VQYPKSCRSQVEAMTRDSAAMFGYRLTVLPNTSLEPTPIVAAGLRFGFISFCIRQIGVGSVLGR